MDIFSGGCRYFNLNEVGRKIGEGHQLVRELERSFPAKFQESVKNLSPDVSRDITDFQENASVSIPSRGLFQNGFGKGHLR